MNATLTVSPLNVNAAGTAYAAANPAPSAQVQLMDGNTVVATAPLVFTLNYSTYNAAFSVTTLGPGPRALTAVFPGDLNYAAATSNAQNISIGATRTTVAATITNVGTSIPFTVTSTVTPVTASTVAVGGTVTFYDGATKLGTANVVNGVATLTTAIVTTVGTHAITAVYSVTRTMLDQPRLRASQSPQPRLRSAC